MSTYEWNEYKKGEKLCQTLKKNHRNFLVQFPLLFELRAFLLIIFCFIQICTDMGYDNDWVAYSCLSCDKDVTSRNMTTPEHVTITLTLDAETCVVPALGAVRQASYTTSKDKEGTFITTTTDVWVKVSNTPTMWNGTLLRGTVYEGYPADQPRL